MSDVHDGGELSGRVAAITGGTSLIGQAIISKLVDESARVVVANNDDPAAADIERAHGRSVRIVDADVRNDSDLDHVIETAVQEFGGLDIVVCGAAIFDCDLLDTTRDAWHRSFDVNVIGSAVLIGKATPHLIERGGGSIVLISSISAKQSQPGRIVYPVTKTAVQGLARNSSQVLAPHKIRVNSVSPGWTWSVNIDRRYGSRERADDLAAEFQPLGRLADPDEVAAAVLFMCSDRSSFVTGSDLAVDGGYSAVGPEALGQAFEKIPTVPTPAS